MLATELLEAAKPGHGLTERGEGIELVPLEDLVRTKLTSFRDQERMHLRDLTSDGLVDDSRLGLGRGCS